MLNVHPLVPFFQEQGFPEQEALAIASAFVHKHNSKGDFFVQEGNTSKYLGFVQHGFLQYYVLLNGEGSTLWLVWLLVAGIILILYRNRAINPTNPAKQNHRSVGHFPTS